MGLKATLTYRFDEGEHPDLEAVRVTVGTGSMRVIGTHSRLVRLAGEIADGAVTWLCPARYLRDVALPAMEKGAKLRGVARPRLVGHAFLALTTNQVDLQKAIGETVAFYPKPTNYQEMFVAAGYAEARSGNWSPGMIDAVILNGDAAACASKVRDFVAVSGCDELILSVMATGADRASSVQRTLDFVGAL